MNDLHKPVHCAACGKPSTNLVADGAILIDRITTDTTVAVCDDACLARYALRNVIRSCGIAS